MKWHCELIKLDNSKVMPCHYYLKDKSMKRVVIRSYLSIDEKKMVQDNASKVCLSASEYIRRIITGTKLPVLGNAKTVTDLLKVNADLARLGNLLKMALDNDDPEMSKNLSLDMKQIIAKIATTKQILETKIMEL